MKNSICYLSTATSWMSVDVFFLKKQKYMSMFCEWSLESGSSCAQSVAEKLKLMDFL